MKKSVELNKNFMYYEIKEAMWLQNKLISLRMSKQITQQEMAKMLNVDVRTYINKEHGITQFKANEMFAISREFNQPIEEIFLPTNFMNHENLKSVR